MLFPLFMGCLAAAADSHSRFVRSGKPAVFFRYPADITSRNLFFGPGGKVHQPHGPFQFVKEDLNGTNPKFVVRDQQGVLWKVKLGSESRPETVASRIVWAAGYFADEDYFLSKFRVEGLPVRLHRGRKFVTAGDWVWSARLKREPPEKDKVGTWSWQTGPFTGTREWNGLRTLMALINNWDLKDENNAIRDDGSRLIYLISDLGATFGTPGRSWPFEKERGNLKSYSDARLFRRIDADYVDFRAPFRPKFVFAINPFEYMRRIRLEWVGHHIPRDDVRWMGRLLARLSPAQVEDAFRAAGYSEQQVLEFSQVLENRIAQLSDL